MCGSVFGQRFELFDIFSPSGVFCKVLPVFCSSASRAPVCKLFFFFFLKRMSRVMLDDVDNFMTEEIAYVSIFPLDSGVFILREHYRLLLVI